MTATTHHTIRLVVQRVQGGSSVSAYRLIAYPPPEGKTFWPVDFSSRDQLIECLRAAFPASDSLVLDEDHGGHIIFVREVQLSSAQLSMLGLLR